MRKSLLAIIVANSFIVTAYAEQTPQIQEVELETIVVSDIPFSQKIGTQKLTNKEIERMPAKDGSITELLKINPNVRFSQTYDNSTGAGEIAPPEVSFHGEKFYNNNYSIDGFSNNDNINPGHGLGKNDTETPDGTNPWDLPAGTTQSMWINPELLKNVEVFDSNISAQYGRFTGGVVNAELKDPDFERHSGKISYRTTRDSWAHFHIQEGKEEEFEEAQRYINQPKFTKHNYSIQINQPINEKLALLLAYDLQTSKIPFNHSMLRDASQVSAKDGTYSAKQERKNESFLLSGAYLADNGDVWKAKAIYSIHTSSLPKKNIYNGGMKNVGGGLQLSLDWEKQFDWLKMKTSVGYKITGNEIEHEGDVYRIYRRSTTAPYAIPYRVNGATVNNGGYGKHRTESKNYVIKQHYESQPFLLGSSEHKMKFGWQIERTTSLRERENPTYLYTYVNTNIAKLKSCSSECILGQQYANRRTVYDPSLVKVNDSTYSAYLEDTIKWKNLETTLGVRFDRNEFLGNNDIAHRTSATYDVFGDETTRLFAGFNRYYAGSMIAYKLRKGIGDNYEQSRTIQANGSLSEWTTTKSGVGGTHTYDISNLKTPYSDERVLGISQQLLGANITAKWVHRDSKKELTRRKNEQGNLVLTNAGSGQNDTFSLVISPLEEYKTQYAEFGWTLGASYSKRKTNNTYYDQSTVEETEKVSKAIYRGQLIDIDDLPPANFNMPWVASLSLNTYFPKLNLNWSQEFNYSTGNYSRHVKDSSISCPSGHQLCGNFEGNVIEYQDEKSSSMLLVNWRFSYEQPTFKNQSLTLSLDVNNVFNKRALVSSTSNTKTYKMGRNFWLGLSYKW